MENSIPSNGEIVWFNCCTNGKPLKGRKIPNHMFLILTNTNYNHKSDHFCGIPLTSKKENTYQEFVINYGFDITNDDIEGNLVLDKETYLLCDRPARLDKNDLSREQKNIGKIKKEKLDASINKISRFLKAGKINY